MQIGQSRIDEMDQYGVDMQMLSYGGAPQLIPLEEAAALTRAANDRLAEAIRAHPTRLLGLATLPWQLPDEAADELERSINQLGLQGSLLNGRPGQAFIDDARYAPVLAKLNELNVPLYVHPGFPASAVHDVYYRGFDPELTARLSLFAWGWHNEAGVQIIRMILSGVFDRYPNLQVISGHWGEMVPFYLQRLDDMIPREVSGLSRSITDTYRQHVYVTPSGMLNRPHFDFVYAVLGAERILYSVDYPYLTMDGARAFLEELPIPVREMELIANGNAERLFRL